MRSTKEDFGTQSEAKVLVERWKREYNQVRPYSSLGYQPPVSEVLLPMGAQVFNAAQQRVAPKHMGLTHEVV